MRRSAMNPETEREREYIEATNLCKARIALQILRDYLPTGGKHDKHASVALAATVSLCRALEKRVKEV
jgi:hypothetical protein